MARSEELMKIYESTKDGCDGKCLECEMYLPNYDKCFHKVEEQRKKWNEREHERFGRILRGEQ